LPARPIRRAASTGGGGFEGVSSKFAEPLPETKGLNVDTLEIQIASALQRFSTLQRRASQEPGDQPRLLGRALKDLELVIEELQAAQAQLLENRSRMEQLQFEVTEQFNKYWQLFDELPQPYVVSKPDSTIAEANKAAAELFNVSQRFLVGKTISVFVCEDRSGFLATAARIATDANAGELSFRLRPRERAPIDVVAKVTGSAGTLRWLFQPSQARVLQG
jgi:PAS domain-containing protein